MTRETTDLGDVGKVGALASLTQYHLLSLGLKYKTIFASSKDPFLNRNKKELIQNFLVTKHVQGIMVPPYFIFYL